MAPRRLSNHIWITRMMEEALDPDYTRLSSHMNNRNKNTSGTSRSSGDHRDINEDFELLSQQEWATDYIWTSDMAREVCEATNSPRNVDPPHECQTFLSVCTTYPQSATITSMVSEASKASVLQEKSRPSNRAPYRDALESGMRLTTATKIYRSGWQFCCHFARLPLEIRQHIYKYAMEKDWMRPILIMDGDLHRDWSIRTCWERNFVQAVFPPLCQASRRLLHEAGPVFLKNVLFILHGGQSLQSFDCAMKCKEVTTTISDASTIIRELWFSAVYPTNSRGCGKDLEANGSSLLREYRGLRRIVVHMEDWCFQFSSRLTPWNWQALWHRQAPRKWHKSVHRSGKHLKRALNANELIQLPHLSEVTIFCDMIEIDENVDPPLALTVVADWLSEGVREGGGAGEKDEIHYHIHDLQRIYEPERDDHFDFGDEGSLGTTKRKDLVTRIKWRKPSQYRFWFEAEGDQRLQGTEAWYA